MGGNIRIRNKLIEKRKKKRLRKRIFLFLVFLVCLLVTLCLKLQYFNIRDIEVYNNKNIRSNEIVKLSGIQPGNNIFYLRIKDIKKNIETNSYILDVKIKRALPNKVKIYVTEREAEFYIKKDNKFLVIDSSGIILELRDDISTMKLIKLEVGDLKQSNSGTALACDDKRKIEVIETFSALIKANKSSFEFSDINISNLFDIKVNFGEICVMLGNYDDLKQKLNKAINILASKELKDAKRGYINVSFSGNPVFNIEQ